MSLLQWLSYSVLLVIDDILENGFKRGRPKDQVITERGCEEMRLPSQRQLRICFYLVCPLEQHRLQQMARKSVEYQKGSITCLSSGVVPPTSNGKD